MPDAHPESAAAKALAAADLAALVTEIRRRFAAVEADVAACRGALLHLRDLLGAALADGKGSVTAPGPAARARRPTLGEQIAAASEPAPAAAQSAVTASASILAGLSEALADVDGTADS